LLSESREGQRDIEEWTELKYRLARIEGYSLGLLGGLVGFLVSATFLSVLYYPQFWWLCTLVMLVGNRRVSILKEVEDFEQECALNSRRCEQEIRE
jgi:hypothetical protein